MAWLVRVSTRRYTSPSELDSTPFPTAFAAPITSSEVSSGGIPRNSPLANFALYLLDARPPRFDPLLVKILSSVCHCRPAMWLAGQQSLHTLCTIGAETGD